MRVVSFIEDQEVIRIILKHLGLWDIRSRPPAKAHAPPAVAVAAWPHDKPICNDPQYPWEACL